MTRTNGLAAKLAELTKATTEIDQALLASASYDGDRRLAVLKFYDVKEERFRLWWDNTGHRPYCLTRLGFDELGSVRARKDVIEITEEEKMDLVNDTSVKLRKIVTTDPLAIGGGNDSIRDMIRAWEADIKYYENYAYDRGLRMGTYYRVKEGKVIPVRHDVPQRVARSLEEILKRNSPEFGPYLREWAELLGEPLLEFKRIALDIEVANEAGRLPDPEDPKQPVIAVSFFNGDEKLVYLLRAGKDVKGLEDSPFSYEVFDEEATLLRAVLSKIMDYPVIVTFNGDDFDLRYLQHRAEALGIGEEENPIQLERVAASLKHGIHIDLYQFFRNRSIQVYAFSNKYSEHTLGTISEILLGKSKIEFQGEIGDLPLPLLAKYCLNDSQLTYELTSMSGSVVMKLLLVISRIGKMPMNDVSRLGVSNWIRSMLFYEHRKIRALIPRQDELAEKGGASSQAIIKGKKYKGGFVIEPKPGVYFDVSVLDFASLVFNESIFVRKRQTGRIYETKIGEFVESRLPVGTNFAAKKIGPAWDVLSFDYDNQRASWKMITAVIRHPNQPQVLELVTESGRSVRVTEGHSVITLDSEGKKMTVRGSELKVGDYLIALTSFSVPRREGRLDLLPYLRQLNGYETAREAQPHLGTKRPPPELLVRAEHVQAFAKTPFHGSYRRNPIRYERVNRTSVKSYKPTFESFYNGNCHFEKIKEIRRTKNDLPVYDISVRGSESFFNADGLLLSNSLYPSLIKVHNLSYETVNCIHPECRVNTIPDTSSWVCTRRKGIVSLVTGSLRDLRVSHYKPLTKDVSLTREDRELYTVVTQGLKVFLNASYGVLGFETFAFYCLPVAEATAALGRFAITNTIKKCEELAIPVIYGDTDSIFLRNPSREQITTITRWAEKDLGVELDLDKTYRYVAFSSRKKNYFGVLPDGMVDIKGLTGRKSQTPEYLKRIFYETLDILSKVQTPEDFEKARSSTRALLSKMISELKGKKVPVADLAFTVMMGKPTEKYNAATPQHVRAAKLLEDKGREIKAGEIIAYVKTKNPPYVKPSELARVDEIDADKYIEYAHSMFDQLLDALDFSFDEIMGATTLDLFWSS